MDAATQFPSGPIFQTGTPPADPPKPTSLDKTHDKAPTDDPPESPAD